MCELLQTGNRIVTLQQALLDLFEISIATYMILSRNSSNRTTLKRIGDKPVCIGKLTVKSGAGVVLLRERKKQLTRAYRTRVDGIIFNLFVKHLSAYACCIRAH